VFASQVRGFGDGATADQLAPRRCRRKGDGV